MVDLQMDHGISEWCDISFEKSFEEKNQQHRTQLTLGKGLLLQSLGFIEMQTAFHINLI